MKTFKEFISICEQASAYGQLRYGSTPAKATDKSVSSAVDKALSAPGTSQSASSQKGKTGVTGSVDAQYSGTVGSRSQPKPQATSTEPARTPIAPARRIPKPDRPPFGPGQRMPKPDRTPELYITQMRTSGNDRDGNEVIKIFNNVKKRVPYGPLGRTGPGPGYATDTTKAYPIKQLPPF